MSEIRVRFAPSPTGVLHLGGARTALFNWLYARHTGGKFLLRIEDTDRERSTEESTRAILDALTWLGMSWDEEPIYQSARIDAHREALQKLIDQGSVYRCYCTAEERKEIRDKAINDGRPAIYDGRCFERSDQPDKPFVWRFRMPRDGETAVDDIVQGRVVTPNHEIEDLVVARSDGSPLYNFAVVVDDSSMGVTHVVRGKDHLTNTPKQIQIYRALGLSVPEFAHLPLILGLSKRLRSAGIETYREQGYLSEAVNNYIVRLGWSHGDQELFSSAELVEKFDLADVNRSEGSLNMEKMDWTNQQHIIGSDPAALAELVSPFFEKLEVTPEPERLAAACETVRQRSKNLAELAEKARFYFVPDAALEYDAKAVGKFIDAQSRELLSGLADSLEAVGDWRREAIEGVVRSFCDAAGIKLKHVAQPSRVALTGSAVGPGLFETIEVLGRQSTLSRMRRAAEIG